MQAYLEVVIVAVLYIEIFFKTQKTAIPTHKIITAQIYSIIFPYPIF